MGMTAPSKWTEAHIIMLEDSLQNGTEVDTHALSLELGLKVSTVKSHIRKFCRKHDCKAIGMESAEGVTILVPKKKEPEKESKPFYSPVLYGRTEDRSRKRMHCLLGYEDGTIWLVVDAATIQEAKKAINTHYSHLNAKVIKTLTPEEFMKQVVKNRRMLTPNIGNQ